MRADAVERAGIEFDSMIHSMIAVAGIIAAIASELPITNEPILAGGGSAAGIIRSGRLIGERRWRALSAKRCGCDCEECQQERFHLD